MSDHAVEATALQDLRTRAAVRLTGAAGTTRATASAADALAVLHTLASSQATAADALALLHELQVHQVELELQAQELRESRVELESALRRRTELYDCQPVACFTVDRHWVIRELNQAGARMLGVERDAACGLRLDTFFSVGSADKLQTLAFGAAQGEPVAPSVLEWRPKEGPARRALAHLGADPAGDGCLIVLTNP